MVPLTAAEAKLATPLADGSDLDIAADDLQIAKETRAPSKAVFAMTDTVIAALVARLLAQASA